MNRNAAGRIALACLLTQLMVVPAVVAGPVQGVVTHAPATPNATNYQSQTESVRLTRNPVLARNTPVKTDPVVTPAKEQKTSDKQTIGRCWKQLMNTFREIHQAHRSQTGNPKK